MIIMKFGGTSVEDAPAIRRLGRIVRERLSKSPVVVVSALSGVTDALARMSAAAAKGEIASSVTEIRGIHQRHTRIARALLQESCLSDFLVQLDSNVAFLETLLRGISAVRELSPRCADLVLSQGEVLSSALVAAALKSSGLCAVHVDSRQAVVTNGNHTCAALDRELTDFRVQSLLLPMLSQSLVPVMGGFIGATAEGEVTTLGRGGSDYTAAIVGRALGADAIEIWTDVEGMLTTDPRICSDAQRIRTISFDEAAELAYFGAKVLHPATLVPAEEQNIPVYVLNSRKAKREGTCIRSNVPVSETMFRAIAAKKGSTVINIRAPRMLFASDVLKALFDILERYHCPVDLVSTSEVSVSLVLAPSHNVDPMLPELRKLGIVEVEPGKAIVCLVGSEIRGAVGVAASVFTALAKSGVNVHMISQGASEINISVVIDECAVPTAVKTLHSHFFPRRRPAAAQSCKSIPSISTTASRRSLAMAHGGRSASAD